MDDCPLEIDHAYFRAGARRPHDATKRPVLRGRVATVTKQSPVTAPRIPRGGHLLQFSAPPTEEKRFRPAWTNLWFAKNNKNGRMTLFGSCGQFLEALKCWIRRKLSSMIYEGGIGCSHSRSQMIADPQIQEFISFSCSDFYIRGYLGSQT